MDDKDLLDIAKGVKQPDFVKKENYIKGLAIIPDNEKSFHSKRRMIRKTLHSVRRKLLDPYLTDVDFTFEESVLKEIFENQLDSNRALNWQSFTFNWDISPADHMKIIIRDHWSKGGGDFDEIGRHNPTAFTRQEI